MRRTLSRATLGVLLTVAGCAAAPSHVVTPTRSVEPKSVEGPEPQLAAYPVIVRIVGRHETITVTAAPGGPRVSAADPAGRMICQGLTMDELRLREPGLYRQVQGQATQADATAVLDAE